MKLAPPRKKYILEEVAKMQILKTTKQILENIFKILKSVASSSGAIFTHIRFSTVAHSFCKKKRKVNGRKKM